MVLGFIMNLVFAKITLFIGLLTGQHFLYFACVLALVFIALGARCSSPSSSAVSSSASAVLPCLLCASPSLTS